MTAPTPDPGLRDRLAEVLEQQLRQTIGREPNPNMVAGLADALLPVVAAHVEQQARERAAAELEAAADVFACGGRSWHEDDLRVRAAALRGQA